MTMPYYKEDAMKVDTLLCPTCQNNSCLINEEVFARVHGTDILRALFGLAWAMTREQQAAYKRRLEVAGDMDALGPHS